MNGTLGLSEPSFSKIPKLSHVDCHIFHVTLIYLILILNPLQARQIKVKRIFLGMFCWQKQVGEPQILQYLVSLSRGSVSLLNQCIVDKFRLEDDAKINNWLTYLSGMPRQCDCRCSVMFSEKSLSCCLRFCKDPACAWSFLQLLKSSISIAMLY